MVFWGACLGGVSLGWGRCRLRCVVSLFSWLGLFGFALFCVFRGLGFGFAHGFVWDYCCFGGLAGSNGDVLVGRVA